MSIGKGKDYYKILGTNQAATQEDIDRAYKIKFAEYGTQDVKNPDTIKKFEDLREAYMTLKNVDRRATYNKSLSKKMDIK
jgi:DnaJ-class molecular chaperone